MQLRIDERQARLVVIGIQAAMSLLVGLAAVALNLGPVLLSGAVIGVVIYTILGYAYWRGIELARHVVVAVTTLLTGAVIVLDSQVATGFTPAFFVPLVLALILTDWIGILASGVTMMLIVTVGVAGQNPYVEPVRVVMVGIVVAGMIVARAVLDTMRAKAEAAAAEARAAQMRAEGDAAAAIAQGERLRQQNEEQQRLLGLVAELETPTVALADGVLLAPIIGSLDTLRTAQLTERLLHQVAEQRARIVILDLAGVRLVDTAVAASLQQLVQAIKLLGCAVTITGISASVAATLTDIGVSMHGIDIARSPQEVLQRHLHTSSSSVKRFANLSS